MKPNLINYYVCLLPLAIGFSCLMYGGLVSCRDDLDEGEFIGRTFKRQAEPSIPARNRQVAKQEVASVGASAAVSSVGEPANEPGPKNENFDGMDAKRPVAQPGGPGKRPNQSVRPDDDSNQDKPPRGKNPLRRPSDDRREDEGGDEEYCYDDYNDDYRQLINEPMRHISRMMNSVFGQMPAGMFMDPGDGRSRSSGGNSAFASSSSMNSGDGFSRMMTSVSNNGRTRGIISETRNGQTQTRRIGRDDDDDVYANSERNDEE